MSVILEPTLPEDLDFVLTTQVHPDIAPFINLWTREQHMGALENPDIAHLIIKERSRPVGFLILAGLRGPARVVELRRLAITDPGRGFGTAALRAVTRLAFSEMQAERLWLEVKPENARARSLYAREGFSAARINENGSIVMSRTGVP